MEQSAPRGRMDEADEVAPGEAVLDNGGRPLADRRPDAAQQGFQANTMFVGRPQLDARLREGVGDRPQEWPELFLNSACCSASARACCGRGA